MVLIEFHDRAMKRELLFSLEIPATGPLATRIGRQANQFMEASAERLRVATLIDLYIFRTCLFLDFSKPQAEAFRWKNFDSKRQMSKSCDNFDSFNEEIKREDYEGKAKHVWTHWLSLQSRAWHLPTRQVRFKAIEHSASIELWLLAISRVNSWFTLCPETFKQRNANALKDLANFDNF